MGKEETEFDLLDKLATQTGLSLPESRDERNSVPVQKRILRHTLKCLKESSRSPGCSTADELLEKIRHDLLWRAEEDSDGCKVVELSSGLWIKLNSYLNSRR